MAIYPSLRNRAVLITGGAGGIGRAISDAFVAQGAKVGIMDRDAAALSEVREALSVEGDKARQVETELCDVGDIGATTAAAQALIKRLGRLDVLVNNAGNDSIHPFGTVSEETFDLCISVNLRHAFFLSQLAAPAIELQGGGSIINLGSISWMIGARSVPVYAAAKAAIEGLTRSTAHELGEKAIRVNSVAPGWVLTDRQLAKGAADTSKFETYLNRQALKEHLQPNDVAELVLWLAADESRLCTGHTWFVDAGATR